MKGVVPGPQPEPKRPASLPPGWPSRSPVAVTDAWPSMPCPRLPSLLSPNGCVCSSAHLHQRPPPGRPLSSSRPPRTKLVTPGGCSSRNRLPPLGVPEGSRSPSSQPLLPGPVSGCGTSFSQVPRSESSWWPCSPLASTSNLQQSPKSCHSFLKACLVFVFSCQLLLPAASSRPRPALLPQGLLPGLRLERTPCQLFVKWLQQ